jgi:hypothetical protein
MREPMRLPFGGSYNSKIHKLAPPKKSTYIVEVALYIWVQRI